MIIFPSFRAGRPGRPAARLCPARLVRLVRAWPLLAALACVLFLSACGGTATEKPYNPMGLSGKVSPEAETAYSRAHVLWKNGEVCSDPELAVSYLDRAIELQPDYAQAYMRRGLAKSDMHDWDAAFDDLSRAIRLDPSPENYAYRGLISMRGGNYLGARKDYDKSLDLRSRQHRAWNFRAALSLLEGKTAAACDDFDAGCSRGDCTGYESARQAGICK